MSENIVTRNVRQTPFLLRAVWFVLIGWELTAVWVLVAWLLNLTIIGLPLGIWMLDRVPQVLTLKAVPGRYVTDLKSGDTLYEPGRQVFFLVRLVYFVLIGWWLSLIWLIVGYVLCLTVIGLPLGLLMLNRLPFITTLHR